MTETTDRSRAVNDAEQLAGLVADLESLAGLWHKSASTEDARYGAHLAGYDEGLRLCARQLRKALRDALDGADEPVPYHLTREGRRG